MSEAFVESVKNRQDTLRPIRNAHPGFRDLRSETQDKISESGFTLSGELGSGATAVTFEASEDATGRTVAIKVYKNPDDKRSMQMFARESRILGSDHVPPDVLPQLFSTKSPSDHEGFQPFLVIERINGNVVDRYKAKLGPAFSVGQKCELLERQFRSVGRQHACNLVHGDTSVRNTIIEPGDQVRFIDLGNGRRLNDGYKDGYKSLNSQGGPVGTPGFAPVGVLAGEEKATEFTDIFGISYIGYYLFISKVLEPNCTEEQIPCPRRRQKGHATNERRSSRNSRQKGPAS